MARTHNNREAIGARLRFDVLRRCNFACYYCGVPAALGLKALHVDHVIPVALGGTNDPWNLVAACWDCNAGKTNGVPPEGLIRQVYDDWCGDPGGTAGQCRYCRIPLLVSADEDGSAQCDSCLDMRAQAYDEGVQYAFGQAMNDLPKILAARGVEL